VGPVEASLGYSLALSPDGARLFAPRHALGALAEAAWFGVATVDVLLTAKDEPLAPRAAPTVIARAEAYASNEMVDRDGGPLALARIAHFTQPRDCVLRARTGTLLVVGEGDNTVVELDARAVDPSLQVVGTRNVRCGAPSGVALSPDESTAYIFCRTSNEVAALPLSAPAYKPEPVIARVADDPLPAPAARGRRHYYDARDSGLSGGLACAGCHPEGRDDGHVWHEIETSDMPAHAANVESRVFVGGPDVAGLNGFARQTPMLAGRVRPEGPYGWHAENPDLASRVFEGAHLHRWEEGAYEPTALGPIAEALAAFLRTGLVTPPKDARSLTPEEARGKEVFEMQEVGCAMCHVPDADYTDRAPHALKPWPAKAGFDVDDAPFRAPSLLFVAGTAPYFHDGSAATLEDMIRDNGKRMGSTEQLSPADRAALVAFLRTL
jgi:cytochrome c peroxidase